MWEGLFQPRRHGVRKGDEFSKTSASGSGRHQYRYNICRSNGLHIYFEFREKEGGIGCLPVEMIFTDDDGQ